MCPKSSGKPALDFKQEEPQSLVCDFKRSPWLYLIPYTVRNSKQIRRLNVRAKIYKTFRRKHRTKSF